MKNLTNLLVALILCTASFTLGRSCQTGEVISNSENVVVDSITTETISPDLAPIVRDSAIIKYEYKIIPITPPPEPSDTATSALIVPPSEGIRVTEQGDSAFIEIPITQSRYETEDYRAYVSGYHATLDSIFITQRCTSIRIREPTKVKRFSFGLQAGYGMTPKGFQPYVGIGVTLNLWSF